MKKTFSIILSALMLAGLTTAASAFEKNVDYVVIEEFDPDNYVAYGDSYPASTDWDWPECKEGQLLKGTVIAGCDDLQNHCWKNTPTGNASAAFDGDDQTLFDPFEASDKSWAGVILDQAYELTEVRVMVRGKYLDRLNGSAIQGSQDGKTWVNVVYFGQNADAEDYHIITSVPFSERYPKAEGTDYSTYFVGSGSYKMYRFVNLNKKHGEAIELELYGNPAPATTITQDLIDATTFSSVNFFNGVVDTTKETAVSTDGSITGTVIGAGGSYKKLNPYQNAWDGKADTYFDPASQGSNCWTGIQVAEPIAVKEVKVMPRADQLVRTNGGFVQGSNDGKMWVTLASFTGEDVLEAQDWITKPSLSAKAFTMFRYVNSGVNHGDVAEVALFSDAVQAPVAEAPETAAPETAAPETAAPETAAPETAAPETAAPETAAPETAAPETAAPETAAPETAAPETAAPETAAPETAAPETAAPETAAPETAAPETAAPETAAPETAAPETAAPETAAPETAAPETEAPETEAPETEAPETEAPAEDDAPQTFDAGIIAAAVAVVSAAGYMIARKRK